MKTKVLVLGSTGLIGHQVFRYLQSTEQYQLHDFGFRKKLLADSVILDARNDESFLKAIKEVSPEIIVNCIGVLINESKKNPENAIFLNAYLPHRLARLADEINAKLIHISTDCVFSGDKNTPYLESDYKDGRDNYAKTKGLGEVINKDHLTLRTSVVGPELKADGQELFHWFMNQSGTVQGYTESIWSGITTIELAKAVDCAIRLDITGLYHVSSNTSITKYELLNLLRKHTKKVISITAVAGKKTDKSFVDTRELLDFQIPSYDRMIFELVTLMRNQPELYSQYVIN